MKILLVDDDKAILELIARFLRHRGHEVQTCETPFGVSKVIMRDPPELVVLDVTMPGLNGPQLANIIAQLHLKKPPKLVLWSALDTAELHEAAREAGGLPTISKGMRASDIVAAIERFGRA